MSLPRSLRPLAGPSRQLALSIPLAARSPHRPCAPISPREICTTTAARSGHNRWSKIRHKKGAADAQRSAAWSRVMTDIAVALRPPSSPNPELNPRLAAALAKAKDAGVPKSNVESAFARAAKMADGSGKAVTFEALAAGKVGVIVECITDNPNRTVARVKELLSKGGMHMTPVSFMFERKGVLRVVPTSPEISFDAYFEAALEGGAEDVRELDEEETVWEALCAPSDLGTLTSLITSPPHEDRYRLDVSELAYLPTDAVVVGDEGVSEEKAEGIERVVEMLEEEADVIKVWTSLE